MTIRLSLEKIAQRLSLDGIGLWRKADDSFYPLCIFAEVDHDLLASAPAIEDNLNQSADLQVIKCDLIIVSLHGAGNFSDSNRKILDEEYLPWFKALGEKERTKHQEESLKLLMEVAHTIASSVQSEEILDVIIKTALDSIDAADTGFLFLYDSNINKLLVKSAIGFRQESYCFTRLDPGEGISGRVFEKVKPLLITDEEAVSKAMESMSKENFKHYLNSTTLGRFPRGVISVPLCYKNEAIGVLTIDNFTHDNNFTGEDLSLLEALANHIAVAIVHADLFQKEREYREELILTHKALSSEHHNLQRTLDIHHRLTNLAAKGKGLEEILQTIHMMLKLPIAVYTGLLEKVASAPEGREINLPDNFFKLRAVVSSIETGKRHVEYLEDDSLLLINPIVGAGEVLGFLCCWMEKELAVDDLAPITIEYGATVLALEWMKQNAVTEIENKLKGQFFEELLGGDINTNLLRRADKLGFTENDHFVIVLASLPELENDEIQGTFHDLHYREKQALLASATELLGNRNFNGISLIRGKYIICLISFSDSKDIKQNQVELHQAFTWLIDSDQRVHAGIGKIYKGLGSINRSFSDARKCFEVSRHFPFNEKRLINYSEIGVHRFLLQSSREELESYLDDIIGPLLEYENSKEGKLVETLVYYTRYNWDLKTFAARLNIHYNTLYYRINRIREILNTDFSDPENWASLQLACQIYVYLKGPFGDEKI